jgi:integrase
MPEPPKTPNIRLHRSGRYEARIQIAGQSFGAYGETELEAAENLQRKVRLSGKLSRDTWSFKQFSEERYMPTINMLSNAYLNQCNWAMGKLACIHNTPIDEIKRPELQSLINNLSKTLSRGSLVHVRKVLYAVLNLAEIDGHIPSNPARHVKLPKVQRSERWVPSLEDIAPLIQTPLAKAYQGYPTLVLASCLGLRIGEIQKLEPRHFKKKGILIVPGTKSVSAARELPLSPLIVAALKDHSFPLAAQSASSARKAVQRLDKRLGPHLLRHFCNTALQELGCPPELRRRIVGHSEKGVQAIYSHSKQIELIREWLDLLAESLFTTKQDRKTI